MNKEGPTFTWQIISLAVAWGATLFLLHLLTAGRMEPAVDHDLFVGWLLAVFLRGATASIDGRRTVLSPPAQLLVAVILLGLAARGIFQHRDGYDLAALVMTLVVIWTFGYWGGVRWGVVWLRTGVRRLAHR